MSNAKEPMSAPTPTGPFEDMIRSTFYENGTNPQEAVPPRFASLLFNTTARSSTKNIVSAKMDHAGVRNRFIFWYTVSTLACGTIA